MQQHYHGKICRMYCIPGYGPAFGLTNSLLSDLKETIYFCTSSIISNDKTSSLSWESPLFQFLSVCVYIYMFWKYMCIFTFLSISVYYIPVWTVFVFFISVWACICVFHICVGLYLCFSYLCWPVWDCYISYFATSSAIWYYSLFLNPIVL